MYTIDAVSIVNTTQQLLLRTHSRKQILDPFQNKFPSMWLTHMLRALEKPRVLDTPVLQRQHAVFNREQLIQHAVDKKELGGWHIEDTVFEEGEAFTGVDLHFLDIRVAELDGKDLG